MKIVDTVCPSCGAHINVDLNTKDAVCEFCGARYLFDDGVQRTQFVGGEEFGYDFEKGRQRAQAEAGVYVSQTPYEAPKKSKIWLWVLGWIFFFPIPLGILIYRAVKHKLDTDGNASSDGSANTAQSSKLALWILGWIFCFPVPLTILMYKNDKLPALARYGIIAAGWIFYVAIIVAAANK